jgi:membrane associated rhomboid family serine protease
MTVSDADFILAEIDRHRRESRTGRVILGVLSVTQLVLALPWLFGSPGLWMPGDATSAHLTRDGSLGLLFAVVGLAVAHSPKRAWFALPLVAVLVAVQTFFGIFDQHQQSTFGVFEAVHALGAAIAVGIALFVKPRKRQHNEPRLRVVRDQ